MKLILKLWMFMKYALFFLLMVTLIRVDELHAFSPAPRKILNHPVSKRTEYMHMSIRFQLMASGYIGPLLVLTEKNQTKSKETALYSSLGVSALILLMMGAPPIHYRDYDGSSNFGGGVPEKDAPNAEKLSKEQERSFLGFYYGLLGISSGLSIYLGTQAESVGNKVYLYAMPISALVLGLINHYAIEKYSVELSWLRTEDGGNGMMFTYRF